MWAKRKLTSAMDRLPPKVKGIPINPSHPMRIKQSHTTRFIAAPPFARIPFPVQPLPSPWAGKGSSILSKRCQPFVKQITNNHIPGILANYFFQSN
jgi:hypothetical protein